MAKQKVKTKTVEKMTFVGFIVWIAMSILRSLLISLVSMATIIPFINAMCLKSKEFSETFSNMGTANLWELLKTEHTYKLVKREKVIEEVWEEV